MVLWRILGDCPSRMVHRQTRVTQAPRLVQANDHGRVLGQHVYRRLFRDRIFFVVRNIDPTPRSTSRFHFDQMRLTAPGILEIAERHSMSGCVVTARGLSDGFGMESAGGLPGR
jgi:hypothetical protein